VTRKQTILGVALLFLACLAIGVVWTLRTEPPSANPWWAGKDAKVRMEVWEPGKDMATFAMTLPKSAVDGMVALGMRTVVQIGHYDMDFRHYWREIQALPPGQRLHLATEDGSTTYVWIETPDVKLPPIRSASVDSAEAASGDTVHTIQGGVKGWTVGWTHESGTKGH